VQETEKNKQKLLKS